MGTSSDVAGPRAIRPSVTRRLDIGRRPAFFPRSGELLQSARGGEELVALHVCVACDGRKIGGAEVLGDQAGVADFLAEPRRGCVAKRVRGDVLLDPSALRRATDDVGEDRLLQASTGETAEDRVGRRGLACFAELQQLLGEASRQRLTSRLSALPELFGGQPVALLPRLRRLLEVDEWVADAFALRPPAGAGSVKCAVRSDAGQVPGDRAERFQGDRSQPAAGRA